MIFSMLSVPINAPDLANARMGYFGGCQIEKQVCGRSNGRSIRMCRTSGTTIEKATSLVADTVNPVHVPQT